LISAGAPPQTPLGELTALDLGAASRQGEGWAGEEEERGEKGEEGKWKGGKGRAPKLLLNQGPSDPCYATEAIDCMERLVSEMTYNVFGTLNPTHSLTHSLTHSFTRLSQTGE